MVEIVKTHHVESVFFVDWTGFSSSFVGGQESSAAA